jgi:uncharacterized protein YbjT (DUF2867 family)
MIAPILVTGAAGGRQGATGNKITRFLLQRGVAVRAVVRRFDQRSDALRELGAEVVQADLLDITTVRSAMRGIRRAYFTYPVQDGLLDATAIFAAAARESGVEMVVNLSQLLPRPEQPTPRQRQHWLGENIFNWAQVGAVHLDATVFFENLRALARGSLLKSNTLLLPWGPDSTLIPMISAGDVARVAVGVLTGPTLASGTILPLVGDVVSVGDIADSFTAMLNKPVHYKETTDEQWLQFVSSANLNAHAIEHLTNLWRYLRTRSKEAQRDYKVTDAIEKFGGEEPQKLRQFLREQVSEFQVA